MAGRGAWDAKRGVRNGGALGALAPLLMALIAGLGWAPGARAQALSLTTVGQIPGLVDFERRARTLVAVDREGNRSRIVLDEAGQVAVTAIELGAADPLVFPGQTPGTLASAATGQDGYIAYYAGASQAYPHGALGDPVEATGLAVIPFGQRQPMVLSLPQDEVFEDLRPTLAALDDSPPPEIITVRSEQDAGAALAIYRVGPTGPVELAATAPIGQPNRWLNPVGVGDFNGDGTLEIAYVQTPHIGGFLRILRYSGDGRLADLGALGDVSNHVFGSPEQTLHAIVDADGDGDDDILVPDQARTALRVIDLDGEGPVEIDRVDLPAPLTLDIQELEDGSLLLGLGDGTLARLVLGRDQ